MSEGSSIRGDDKSRPLSATGAAVKSARITQRAAGIAVINPASIAKPCLGVARIARGEGSRNSGIYLVIFKEIKSPDINELGGMKRRARGARDAIRAKIQV